MSGGSAWSRRIPWIVLGFVVVIALAFGSGAIHGQTEDDRVMAIAATIKCPQCEDESSATSEASEAVAIRSDIAVRLKKGQSADDIRGYYASKYGEQILLDPGRTGAASLVWILPVLALVAAFGGLGVIFARWRGMATAEASRRRPRPRRPGPGRGP